MTVGPVRDDIIFWDGRRGICVEWNGSATFNVWEWEPYADVFADRIANTDCFTVYGVHDVAHAQTVAREWLVER